ncbi:MAG: helix-turn-helix domain-containing protein [Prevotella sp.]|nr:helix-turn-helix domain-containing protein [Prevotella sp.]
MDLMTKRQFESCMERVFERFDRQDELLLAIKSRGEVQGDLSGDIRLYDNQDVCRLLQVSKRTLQRYRSIGVLSYKVVGKKTYYTEADILRFLSNNVKEYDTNDIEFYRARIRNLFNK